jgi:hypothetical protein
MEPDWALESVGSLMLDVEATAMSMPREKGGKASCE